MPAERLRRDALDALAVSQCLKEVVGNSLVKKYLNLPIDCRVTGPCTLLRKRRPSWPVNAGVEPFWVCESSRLKKIDAPVSVAKVR